MEYREHRELAIEAARAAGEIIRAAWHRPRSVAQKKGEADLVTQTDEARALAGCACHSLML